MASRPAAGVPSLATTVGDAMLTRPALHAPTLSIARARVALADPHRHLLLLVSASRLLGAVALEDLDGERGEHEPALSAARLEGRTVRPEENLARVHIDMTGKRLRRLAVVDAEGLLRGLLCLKASGRGFCTDAGVRARSV